MTEDIRKLVKYAFDAQNARNYGHRYAKFISREFYARSCLSFINYINKIYNRVDNDSEVSRVYD